MSKKLCLVLSVIVTATMLLAACAPAAPVQPTTAPAATAAALKTAAALPNGSSIKVGLITDTGGVNDQSFNQLAWEGVQKAAKDIGFQAKCIESNQPTDYEKNIDAFATEGYNVIITVGSVMGDATALKAKQYPNITFAIIDNSYVPTATLQNGGVGLAPFHDWDNKIPADLKAQIQKASDGITAG